ncbi:MAG: endo-1,4-beta-xylanase [Propionibacteriaceae bacterium]|jgi:GH35 family endo-1,4-beta-xylanase|nr:endo-1,4-beta-xylanase [Propionibacteriaceae bacterium]
MNRIQVSDTSIPHRLADVELQIAADGVPQAEVEVTIEQTKHEFIFGNAAFCLIDHANGIGKPGDQALADLWFDLFNAATLPFYWGEFEPERGKPHTGRLLNAAKWFTDNGAGLKGHPLTWHTVQPTWLTNLPLPEIESALRHRIRREVSNFAPYINTWDALNEAVIAPVFTAEENGITKLTLAKGRLEMIRLSVLEAKAANPNAQLLINDFDLSSAYEILIEGILEAGIQIDVLGLQTHMHQGYWGEEKMTAMIDRFARYGLPCHLTENSLVSGHLMPAEIVDLNDYQIPVWPSTEEGLARQADEAARHFRNVVSHPATASITYWDFADGQTWLGAPTGLVFEDGTPKPSYKALHALIKGEWWVPATTVSTDGEGKVRLHGFAGDYQVSTAAGSANVTVTRSETGVRPVEVSTQSGVQASRFGG